MLLDRAKDLYDERVEPTLSRLLRGSQLMDKVCNLMCVASHMQGLCVGAQVANQSVGKVARVAAKPTSHTAKVVMSSPPQHAPVMPVAPMPRRAFVG